MKKKEELSPFDSAGMIALLKTVNADQKSVNLEQFYEVCKGFVKLSGNLGSLVAWGFEGSSILFSFLDINEKCQFLHDHMVRYSECKTMSEIVDKEMALNLHVLSGSNSEKYGYTKGHPLYKYESGTRIPCNMIASRTILRLVWYLTLVVHLFKNLREYPGELLSNVAAKSYNDSIASFHTTVLQQAIKAAFLTVPTRAEFMRNAFGTADEKTSSELLVTMLKLLAAFVARIWKYYQEKKLTSLE